MSTCSIEALIATEKADCHIFGGVRGTPRTYGDRKTEVVWRTCVRDGLWQGINSRQLPIDAPVFLTFSFRVNPRSKAYNRNASPNGPDIDTMVIGALSGIVAGRTHVRPSLRLLSRASNCWGFAATKEVIEDDSNSGVDITISMRPPLSLAAFRAMLPAPNLSVVILRGKKRQEMARSAVESQNSGQRFFPTCNPISMAIAFNSNGRDRNITSADHIEALIDGMGAATVGRRRFFDNPRGRKTKEHFYFDDSCVFSLLVGRFLMQESSEVDAVVDVFS